MQSVADRLISIRARLRWNQDYVDPVIAFVVAAGVLANARDRGGVDAFGYILLILQTVPIALRRRDPLRVLGITGISITLYYILGYPDVGSYVGTFVAFYTVAAHSPRRTAAIMAMLTALACFISLVAYIGLGGSKLIDATLNAYLTYGIAWLIGDYVRVRRLHIEELEERAARLEREREERARLAVTEERGRIARELHDVVAHHVSVMVVQAAAAKRVVETNPELAREALTSVEEAGRTALAEMRHMLAVLRAQQPGLAPQPRLDEIEELVANVRAAGLPVSLEVGGERRNLPAGIDLAAYRIVQEALTNVVKHAGPKAQAHLSLRYERTGIEIVVEDDGRGAAAALTRDAGGGHGLIGMRERVALYGGRLEIGPKSSGGFRVSAFLPVAPTESAPDRRATLAEIANAVSDRPGVPSDGNVYPWPEYP